MAKVLIDIPEHNLNVIKRFVGGDGVEELPPRIIEDLIRSVYLGIVLDGLTNGEVIQKMFPNAKISFEEEWDSYDDGDFCNSYVERFVNVEFEHAQTLTFSLDWWNAKWGE